jgi:hypothetical protein
MPPGGFEPTIPASARPQTHALERAATGIALKAPNAHKILKYPGMICQLQLGNDIPFKRELVFTTQLSGHQNLVCDIWVRLVNVRSVLQREAL